MMWAKLTSTIKKETSEESGKEDGKSEEKEGRKGKSKDDEKGKGKINPKVTVKEKESESLDDPADDLITLNVGGIKHQTSISTLKKLKSTRLTAIADKAKATGKREFFFDRHPDLFPYILNFYRSGKLHMPTNICGPLAKEELNYWKIDDKDIQQCCWVHYINHEETLEMLERFEKDEHRHRQATEAISPSASFLQKQKPMIWRGLQEPSSSKAATVFATVSFSVVILSIVIFIIETLPAFDSIAVHQHTNITNSDIRKEFNIFQMEKEYHMLLIIDNCCNLFFFCEFILKFFAAPSKLKFMKIPMTIVELLCIIPYYLAVLIVFLHPDPKSVFVTIRILFATRLLRIFRIFIIMKHNLALKVLVYTMKASTKELLLLLLVVIIGVIIFASLEFYMEVFGGAEDVEINHIPMALWWALITMTTVGYGDFVPKSGPGYAVGAICATSGVLVIALSVPAIVNNFTLYYMHAKSRMKLRQRKRKFHVNIWHKLTENALKGKGNTEQPSFLSLVTGAIKRDKIRKTPVVPLKPISDKDKNPSSSDDKKESVGPSDKREQITDDGKPEVTEVKPLKQNGGAFAFSSILGKLENTEKPKQENENVTDQSKNSSEDSQAKEKQSNNEYSENETEKHEAVKNEENVESR